MTELKKRKETSQYCRRFYLDNSIFCENIDKRTLLGDKLPVVKLWEVSDIYLGIMDIFKTLSNPK